MNVQALKQQALAKVEAAYVAAEAHYGRKFTRVPVVFSAQQKTTAGTANYQYDRFNGKVIPKFIKLSLPLLMLNGEEFIARTPGHEAAHLIAIELYNMAGRGHGAAWQQVMHVIGQKAERCHNMKTARVTVAITCACSTHNVSKTIAQRIMAGAKYNCRKCKTVLSLKGATVNDPVATLRAANAAAKPAAPAAPAAPKATAPKAGSKASMVVALLSVAKANGTTLEQLLADSFKVQAIATGAGLTAALCKTYIKNNWSKA